MNDFKLLDDSELDNLDNLELMEYKRKLYDHGYEIETYLVKAKNQWEILIKILKERMEAIEYDLAVLQADREDQVGETDSVDHLLH